MIPQKRQHIKSVLLRVLENAPQLSLPINIQDIIRSYKGCDCRIVTYSEYMKFADITYEEMLAFAQTEHAYADYNPEKNRAIICYNDMVPGQISSNRYRWNIAHELGHIALRHHVRYPSSRLYRNTMSKAEYAEAEEEADFFASYMLVPHAALYYLNVNSIRDIRKICMISQKAAEIRFEEYNKWLKRSLFKDGYDHRIRALFYSSLDKQYHAFHVACKRCGNAIYIHQKYCTMCGYSTKIKVSGDDIMQYKTYPKNENGQVKECLSCGNEFFPQDGQYCHICGEPIINRCNENLDRNDEPTPCRESEGKEIPLNARFCPYCGGSTLFWHAGILKDWQIEKEEIEGTPQNSIETGFFTGIIPDEDLPF